MTATGWSFPSSHTAHAVVVFAATAILVTHFVHGRVGQVVSWAVAFALAGLVGFSRIEVGVHWTTDVAAGFIWTACWVAIVLQVLRPLLVQPPAAPRGVEEVTVC